MTIGEVVHTLRVSAGLKQTELAERAGVSASSVSLVESGRREPTIKWLRTIAPSLGVSAAVLFAAALAFDDEESDPRAREVAEQLVRAARTSLLEQRLQDRARPRERSPTRARRATPDSRDDR